MAISPAVILRSGMAVTQLMMLLPGAERNATLSLYETGAFGSGKEGENRFWQAISTNAIVASAQNAASLEAIGTQPESRKLTLQSILKNPQESGISADSILRHVAGGTANKLMRLFENPPSLEKAVRLTEKSGNLFNRFIGAVTFGRMGAGAAAAREWAKLVAYTEAMQAVADYETDQLSNGAQPRNLNDRLRQDILAEKRDKADGLVANPMRDRVQERLESAIYTLENPRIFEKTTRSKFRDVALKAIEDHALALQRDDLVSTPKVGFGELFARVAGEGLLIKLGGKNITYEDARALADIAMMRTIDGNLGRMMVALPERINLPSDLNDVSGFKRLALETRQLAEALAPVTQSYYLLGKEWTRIIREDEAVYNPVRDALEGLSLAQSFQRPDVGDSMIGLRQMQAISSAGGFELARRSLRLAEQLEQVGNLTPESRAGLLAQAGQLQADIQEFSGRLMQQQQLAARWQQIALEGNVNTPLAKHANLAEVKKQVDASLKRVNLPKDTNTLLQMVHQTALEGFGQYNRMRDDQNIRARSARFGVEEHQAAQAFLPEMAAYTERNQMDATLRHIGLESARNKPIAASANPALVTDTMMQGTSLASNLIVPEGRTIN